MAAARVAGVLLAGGEGRRFGASGHKLLADFRGRPLVEWAATAVVAAGLDGCCAVTGAVDLGAVLGPMGITTVHNPQWRSGQASSLQAGLAWCRDAGFGVAVVGLGDQPLVPSSAWRIVADATAAAGARPIVTATYGGRRRPPVGLHCSVWMLLPTDGDEGARVLMQRRPELVGEVACEGDPVDIDTAADVERYGRARPAGETTR